MSKKNFRGLSVDRKGERGAALVTSILISTLLLTVAGTVILTSSMSGTTAFDATSELQAYYGAESGLEAALNVLRGNVAPDASRAGTKMGFRNAVETSKSNLPGDTSAVGRFSAWLTYNSGRITPAGANFSYALTVIDPDDPNGTIRTANAAYRPTRLLVQSTGFGPRGATKKMEMVVERTHFDFSPACTVCGVSADDGSKGTWTVGSSASKFYTGHDNAGGGTDMPTFGVTSVTDVDSINDSITKPATVADTKVAQLPSTSVPDWLQSADKAREFLNYMQGISRSLGRYFTSFSGEAGTTTDPKFTFVNGNATLDGGAGLIIVTGDLVLNGNSNFNGVILVLGNGSVTRQGAGNGDILGSIYVAKFARSWPASENGFPHPFLAPTFDTDGGGNGDMRFDSAWVQKSKEVLGTIVRDVREY